MKKVLLLLSLLVAVGVKAAPLTLEEPFTSCADQFTVTLSTSAYTAVPTTPCAGRVGMGLRNPGTNSVNVVCAVGEHGGDAPTWAAAGGWVELTPGSYELFYVGDQTKVYCYSITSAVAVKGQDLKPNSKGAW